MSREGGMHTYQCFYLEKGVRQANVYVVARDDADALLRAEEMLADSRFISVEIRQAARLVGYITLQSPAALMTGEGSGHTPPPR